jgi:hypothetical protein
MIKSPTGPRLLLDSTALHCSAGCHPTYCYYTYATRCGVRIHVVPKPAWVSPAQPRLPPDSKVVHWLKGGEWALLMLLPTRQSAEHGAVEPQNGMSFPHSMSPLPSVHRPNQVPDWTSTLAQLDCTTLLCWMPPHLLLLHVRY